MLVYCMYLSYTCIKNSDVYNLFYNYRTVTRVTAEQRLLLITFFWSSPWGKMRVPRENRLSTHVMLMLGIKHESFW